MNEKEFEDILAKYPELIEEGLNLLGRQITLYGRRMDLLFEDQFKRKLIVELKAGPIKDEHIGQILSYQGMLLSSEDPTIRVMLVGNRVSPNIRRVLDHYGIAWKEIPFSQLRDHLFKMKDEEFLGLLEGEVLVPVTTDSGKTTSAVEVTETGRLLARFPRNWLERDAGAHIRVAAEADGDAAKVMETMVEWESKGYLAPSNSAKTATTWAIRMYNRLVPAVISREQILKEAVQLPGRANKRHSKERNS